MTHKCPVSDCKKTIDQNQAMCGHHWSKLPDEPKKNLLELWHRAKGSRAHLEALHDCIKAVEKIVEEPKLGL